MGKSEMVDLNLAATSEFHFKKLKMKKKCNGKMKKFTWEGCESKEEKNFAVFCALDADAGSDIKKEEDRMDHALCKGALLASRDSKRMARKCSRARRVCKAKNFMKHGLKKLGSLFKKWGEEELQDVEGDEEEDVQASWKLGSLFGAADVEESQADSSDDEAWSWNE